MISAAVQDIGFRTVRVEAHASIAPGQTIIEPCVKGLPMLKLCKNSA